ncbi:sugar phosphate isomerase [Pullulanibacillus camelliae]|uniref:Sugar phosphate isomerase n=1 Tax=Pullulanibacillus camelliae TaxID=1707096 RepID=A0A8J2YKQ5_9BACL|nr:sugar phosphate isomerase/epimerase [Pullulanibacillus camelliae]GGE49278.1 sugar phosphate isomerase [Pullulanibacillus camelliae]
MQEKFAAQLFTLREELKRGIAPVFKELKQMGWAGVQISALPEGYDPDEVAAALKENQLGTAGMHISLQRMEEDLSGVLQEADLYNTKDIVCPFLPESLRTVKGYKEVRSRLNRIAEDAFGYRISYHNHNFELATTMDGKTALEYLLEPSEDNRVLAEVDLYWVKKGGGDPLAFIQPYKNRMPIIHLKDMTDDEEETFAEVGTGKIDFAPILRWCERSGVEWYAVEQDKCPGDPMQSLEISLKNLNQLALQMQ